VSTLYIYGVKKNGDTMRPARNAPEYHWVYRLLDALGTINKHGRVVPPTGVFAQYHQNAGLGDLRLVVEPDADAEAVDYCCQFALSNNLITEVV